MLHEVSTSEVAPDSTVAFNVHRNASKVQLLARHLSSILMSVPTICPACQLRWLQGCLYGRKWTKFDVGHEHHDDISIAFSLRTEIVQKAGASTMQRAPSELALLSQTAL